MNAEIETNANHSKTPVMEIPKKAPVTKEILNIHSDLNIVRDIEGNMYRTVKIGNQEWMLDDLRIRRFDNLLDDYPVTGIVPKLLDSGYNYHALGDENPQIYLYCHFSEMVYALGIYAYNWYGPHVMRNVMPKGWHLPSKEEWETAADYVKHNGCILPNSNRPVKDIRKVLKLFEYGTQLSEVIPESFFGLLNKYGYWLSRTISPFREDQVWGFFAANDDSIREFNTYLHKTAVFHVRFVNTLREDKTIE